MLFNSFAFAVFFPVVFALYWLLRRTERARLGLLLAASYVFYGFWSVHYLGLIVFSTLLDFGVGAALGRTEDPRRRRWLLVASLVGNLGVLGTFKYFDFFSSELTRMLGWLGLETSPFLLEVALPVGISFYTFQTLSYTIDVHRRQLEPEPSLLRFALFVAFFPQLVAGPIVRAVQFLPQLRRPARLEASAFESGLALVFWGLAKKVLIADFLGRSIVDAHYAQPELYGGWTALLSLYAYSFQIYGDFSGYSDVAIGLGRMLGFSLPQNFDSPYRATTMRDFWRRWHISFSTWFRDYVFFPLGGTRGTKLQICRAMFVTMALVGLWHGAAWTFVVFGLVNGVLIVIDIFFRVEQPTTQPKALFKWALTYHLCVSTMIMFRAPDMATAWRVWTSPLNEGTDVPIGAWTWVALGVAAATHFVPHDAKERLRAGFVGLAPELKGLAYTAVLGLILNAETLRTPFIYFQF